jgi:AraC family transcriptional regulator, regulatory protein of adaptative response / methylated-DNA-[protein]-cysteine methyltransferase
MREDSIMNILADTPSQISSVGGDEARWAAVVGRDASADGRFYYSVRTCGVYCRPSCKARPALRKNVGFHATCAEAEQAGFRACKRCKPNSTLSSGMIASAAASCGNAAIRFGFGICSLGSILVATSGKGICAILLGDDGAALLDDLHARFPRSAIAAGDEDVKRLVAKVVSFVEAPTAGLDWPLDVKGTNFQRRVWQVLRDIPAGCTASFADVAERIGSPRAIRAVAQACTRNSIAVAIPCHRVIRSDGALAGYRWGVARKHALLAREAAR